MSDAVMKRYLVFTGCNCYPSGGWEDFNGSFDSIEEAHRALDALNDRYSYLEWFQIVDTSIGEVISDGVL